MNVLKQIGHWLHLAEEDTIGRAVKVVHDGVVVTDELKAQMPTLATETALVATDVMQCKALGVAIAAVVAAGGTDIAADGAVLLALVTDGPKLIKLFTDAGQLISTATGDIKADLASV